MLGELYIEEYASSVVEYGDDFEVRAECFDVAANCWDGGAVAAFDFRH